jgi:hypothetical protein
VPRAGTKIPPIFTDQDGRSLSTYINYYLCAGQQQAAPLGYSPLPINLVSGAFLQVNKIPGTVGAPTSVSEYYKCGNPTFNKYGQDILLEDAPYPNACQKITAPLNCNPNASTSSSAGDGKDKTGGAGSPTSGASAGTGGTSDGNGNGNGTSAVQNANITGSVVNVPGSGADRILLAVITALGVAVTVAAPPSVAAYLRRRRGAR